MPSPTESDAYTRKLTELITVIQQLSLAKDLAAVMGIVRHAARELTGADGATFVLRDEDCCYYADEDAIAPLWKGKRFPMSACISGWVMEHKVACAIEDIYADPRVPADAYRPTFVKSLLMVPIRTVDPIGAIGNYWALPHKASAQEIRLLQALADTTAVALENVRVYAELERRVRERTAQLEELNALLERENAVRRRVEAEVRRQAITDTLTGLLNRRGFFEAATTELAQVADRTGWFMVYLDLDGLKVVNDSLGHDTGDRMIMAAAEVIRAAFGGQLAARIGGDEFAVVAKDGSAAEVRERIEALVHDYVTARRPPFRFELSVGVAAFPRDEEISLGEMLTEADRAMYQHKKGKARKGLQEPALQK